MYRPTIRCSDVYRTYFDELFHATTLDRNQIMRCAMFSAAYNPLFLELMNHYKRSDVPLPSPLWKDSHHELWMEQDIVLKEEGGRQDDVNQRKKSPSNTYETSRTSGAHESIPKSTVSYNRPPHDNGKTSEEYRCEPPVTRPTRTVSSLPLRNGGIKLDLR